MIFFNSMHQEKKREHRLVGLVCSSSTAVASLATTINFAIELKLKLYSAV